MILSINLSHLKFCKFNNSKNSDSDILHTYSQNAQLFKSNTLKINKNLCNKLFLAQCAIQ